MRFCFPGIPGPSDLEAHQKKTGVQKPWKSQVCNLSLRIAAIQVFGYSKKKKRSCDLLKHFSFLISVVLRLEPRSTELPPQPLYLETGSCHVAQSGPKLVTLMPQAAEQLRLQTCDSILAICVPFLRSSLNVFGGSV